MKTIYKYNVPSVVKGSVKRFLQPQMQNGVMRIWAEIDDKLEEKEYYVMYVGTGWFLEPEDEEYKCMEDGIYCGTVIDGPFVWHVYAVEIKTP